MYLNNAWYCAGWEHELDKPKGLKMLGKPLMILKQQDGKIVTLDGACPHRFAPLYKGLFKDDVVQCPYHGLEFNTDGKCVHNPHSDHIPPAAELKSYPTKVRNNAIWVWMGDPDKVTDELLPPEMDWASSDSFAIGYGYTHVRANYMLTVDNLLDLSHAAYLHTESFGAPEPPHGWKNNVHCDYVIEEYRMHSQYYHGEMDTLELFKPLFPQERCVQHSFMTLHLPSNLTFDITISEPGAKDRHSGLNIPSFHFVTPEDEKTAHYFYAFGRNALIDVPEVTEGIMAGINQAFMDEDEPMIKEIQELMGTTDLLSLKPAVLITDKANMAARRKLKKMIAEEQSG
jgi:vanillate O-demethylase monooxygenase subunit